MLAPASSTDFFRSLKLAAFIMVNVIVSMGEILQEDYRLNNSY